MNNTYRATVYPAPPELRDRPGMTLARIFDNAADALDWVCSKISHARERGDIEELADNGDIDHNGVWISCYRSRGGSIKIDGYSQVA
ncbi:hypothetical protein [Desertimonas flava]|uniref:hypothetical protein n=1 Tax=Desertimonas flava TaxID=2064846 RepID=UPI0013C4B775|nr:hypothetical protein [Desertimonas flava]